MSVNIMTTSVFEGHSPIAGIFKCDISYLRCIMQSICICKALVKLQ